MAGLQFKDAFWNSNFIVHSGYEAIISRMQDGRRMCKDVEELIKLRAQAEEKYGKELIQIARKTGGLTELNTLKASFDCLKQRNTYIGISHVLLCLTERQQLENIKDFAQEQIKEYEAAMEKLQKTKVNLYRKTLESKKNYEHKCKEADEAEQASDRISSSANQKQIEKSQSKAKQCREAANEADKVYKQNIEQLDNIRIEWEREHINTCEAFQQQECDRICMLRNALWVHCNQLSMYCVKNDELYEEIRKSLENCDANVDIDCFITKKATGSSPPVPVPYENYYDKSPITRSNGSLPGSTSSGSGGVMKRFPPFFTTFTNRFTNLLQGNNTSRANINEAATASGPQNDDKQDGVYASVMINSPSMTNTSQDYRVLYDYTSQNADELDITTGDIVQVIEEGADGWWMVERNGFEGLVPGSYLEKV
nr:PREDICTED: proline-serine-threonine phosphatase-interacting protein 1 [Latimeria chalumnae]|eukprot:XP_005995703.1 PREDICTED: proline-serine-threonine phosphatase-interacting protein 1 [Latimeria chalumnae]